MYKQKKNQKQKRRKNTGKEKIKTKNKKDTSAYVQPMQPSATRDMGS